MEDAIKVHWLPCTVSHTGPAKVGAYFMPKSTGSPSRAVPLNVEDSGNCIQCAFTPGQSIWAIHAGQQTDGYQVEEAHFRGRQLKGMSWQRVSCILGASVLYSNCSGGCSSSKDGMQTGEGIHSMMSKLCSQGQPCSCQKATQGRCL